MSIDLGNCGITDNSIQYPVQLLRNNGAKPGLRELTLSANSEVTSTGWLQFCMGLSAECHLQALYLDYNHIGPEAEGGLIVALAGAVSLITLDLESTDLSDRFAELLLHLFENHKTVLQHVDLKRNNINKENMRHIKNFLLDKIEVVHPSSDSSTTSDPKDRGGDNSDFQLTPVHNANDTGIGTQTEDVEESADFIGHNNSPNRGRSSGRGRTPRKLHSPRKPRSPWRESKDNESNTDSSAGDDEQSAGARRSSEEGSFIETMNNYFNSSQTVYSNMYLQAEQERQGQGEVYVLGSEGAIKQW